MRKRLAILHIGTAKTGSTSIQRLLAGSRDALVQDGFAYPRTPGRMNHFRLAICFADPKAASRLMRAVGEQGELTSLLNTFRKELDAELAALPDTVHTVIFSNEHTSSKINSPAAAKRLRAFLEPWFDQFRIIAYLRRQDEFAVSRYTTRLRAGGYEIAVLPSVSALIKAEEDDEEEEAKTETEAAVNALLPSSTQPISRALDYAAMLDNWVQAFGKEAVTPRIFDRQAFDGGDLATDFLRCCGLPDAYAKDARHHNASLLPEAQEFLRRLNEARRKAYGEGTKMPKMPGNLRRALAQHYTGSGRLPSRADARAFVERFEEANKRLLAAYFPERSHVFSDDFSKYPEVADPLPSDSVLLEVAIRILIGDGGATASSAAAEECYRRGQELLSLGRTSKAAKSFREAMKLSPTLGRAKRALRAIEKPKDKRRDAPIEIVKDKDATAAGVRDHRKGASRADRRNDRQRARKHAKAAGA